MFKGVREHVTSVYKVFSELYNAPDLHFNRLAYYLRVSDIETDEHGRIKINELLLMRSGDIDALGRLGDDAENALSSLLIRPQRGIRLYLSQDLYPLPLKRAIAAEAGDVIRWLSLLPGRRGYYGLSNQWKTPEPAAHFDTMSFLVDSGELPILPLKSKATILQPGIMSTIKSAYISEQDDGGLICKQILKCPIMPLAISMRPTETCNSAHIVSDIQVSRTYRNA